MKTKSFFSSAKIVLTICALGFPLAVFAKTINLYEQPKTDSKVVSTIDLSTGIIPIYSPKEGKWVKVADPKNGNVGWIQSSELSGAGSSSFSFTQSISNDNKAPVTYKLIQLGDPKNLNSEQAQAVMKQVKAQQEAIQKSIQKMMQEMDQQFHFMRDPFIMPIMVVPVETQDTKPQPNPKVAPLQKIKPAPLPTKSTQ